MKLNEKAINILENNSLHIRNVNIAALTPDILFIS